jgi:hypothetical protein
VLLRGGGEIIRISYALLALRHAVRDLCATALYNHSTALNGASLPMGHFRTHQRSDLTVGLRPGVFAFCSVTDGLRCLSRATHV